MDIIINNIVEYLTPLGAILVLAVIFLFMMLILYVILSNKKNRVALVEHSDEFEDNTYIIKHDLVNSRVYIYADRGRKLLFEYSEEEVFSIVSYSDLPVLTTYISEVVKGNPVKRIHLRVIDPRISEVVPVEIEKKEYIVDNCIISTLRMETLNPYSMLHDRSHKTYNMNLYTRMIYQRLKVSQTKTGTLFMFRFNEYKKDLKTDSKYAYDTYLNVWDFIVKNVPKNTFLGMNEKEDLCYFIPDMTEEKEAILFLETLFKHLRKSDDDTYNVRSALGLLAYRFGNLPGLIDNLSSELDKPAFGKLTTGFRFSYNDYTKGYYVEQVNSEIGLLEEWLKNPDTLFSFEPIINLGNTSLTGYNIVIKDKVLEKEKRRKEILSSYQYISSLATKYNRRKEFLETILAKISEKSKKISSRRVRVFSEIDVSDLRLFVEIAKSRQTLDNHRFHVVLDYQQFQDFRGKYFLSDISKELSLIDVTLCCKATPSLATFRNDLLDNMQYLIFPNNMIDNIETDAKKQIVFENVYENARLAGIKNFIILGISKVEQVKFFMKREIYDLSGKYLCNREITYLDDYSFLNERKIKIFKTNISGFELY
jgi:hypothetical protein